MPCEWSFKELKHSFTWMITFSETVKLAVTVEYKIRKKIGYKFIPCSFYLGSGNFFIFYFKVADVNYSKIWRLFYIVNGI